MNNISPAAKERIKADQRSGTRWFVFWVVVVIGALVLSKLDLLDIKNHFELLMLPVLFAVAYTVKGEARKLIQEELHDESIK